MEKTRTLYRLRQFKNSMMINSFVLLFGIVLFSGIIVFETAILAYMKEHVTSNLIHLYQNNINDALNTCSQAFHLLEKAASIAIVFSLEGFLMVFVYIRMSRKTSKFSTMSPVFLGLGTLLLSVSYLIVAALLPSSGQLTELFIDFQFIRIAGVIIILFSNLLFLYQVFVQVVLEKIDE